MATSVTLNESMRAFIAAQPMFFVATAGREGRVNVSGSGNETAAHVLETGRMTLMFCAFEGAARILRVYGTAKVYHPRDVEWLALAAQFPAMAGARQVFDLAVDSAHISCGTGVPLMEYRGQRGPEEMLPFYAEMPEGGLEAYWARKNTTSIDGKPTGIFGG